MARKCLVGRFGAKKVRTYPNHNTLIYSKLQATRKKSEKKLKKVG